MTKSFKDFYFGEHFYTALEMLKSTLQGDLPKMEYNRSLSCIYIDPTFCKVATIKEVTKFCDRHDLTLVSEIISPELINEGFVLNSTNRDFRFDANVYVRIYK